MRVISQQNIKKLFSQLSALSIFLVIYFLLFNTQMANAQNQPFVVVLDPGHGGKDPGTIGTKRYKNMFEKDIVLAVALKLGTKLENEVPDVKVIYTRKTDVFIELHKRGEIANKADADLFISIHINAASPSAKGTETYVLGVHRNASNLAVAKKENDVILLEDNYEKHYSYDPSNPQSIIGLTLMQEDYLDQSIKMAKIMENSFQTKGKRNSKGVKQAGFVVLHQSYMPAILTEIGFLSNVDEEDFLRTDKGQETIADAMFEAIIKYKNEIRQIQDSGIIISGEEINTENTSHEIASQISDRIYENVIFKVQIATGQKDLETKASNFKGLHSISKEKVNNLYKYYYGNTNNYDDILRMKNEAKEKGYLDCFVIAIKNGERISVAEIINN